MDKPLVSAIELDSKWILNADDDAHQWLEGVWHKSQQKE